MFGPLRGCAGAAQADDERAVAVIHTVIARSEATKQSSFASAAKKLACFASLAMTGGRQSHQMPPHLHPRLQLRALPHKNLRNPFRRTVNVHERRRRDRDLVVFKNLA